MLFNWEKLIMLQNSLLIHGDLTAESARCYKQKSIVKNEPLTCFKMMSPYILNPININFWCFNKLND